METAQYAKSIPLDEVLTYPFRNLKNAVTFAIDIGGSLTKLAYYSTVKFRITKVRKDEKELYDVSESEKVTPRLHFIVFENQYLEEALDFITEQIKSRHIEHLGEYFATGGGSMKFAELLRSKLGVEVKKLDEIECVVRGCNFLLNHIPDEAFSFQRDEKGGNKKLYHTFDEKSDTFPYLLVNIGSGVSIICIKNKSEWERVGGTAMGGGTFWGLGRLLTGVSNFDDLLDLAEQGSREGVDTLVKDIYGGNYNNIGLSGEVTASSFCKAATTVNTNPDDFKKADKVKSLLHMISNDIAQLAYLYAKVNNCKKIIFGGFFIRGHAATMHTISFGVNYWSKGMTSALFLRHEGYLGAIGAFMNSKVFEENELWGENYASSSGYRETTNTTSEVKKRKQNGKSISTLELDIIDIPSQMFPFLKDPKSYEPDTWDLTDDRDSRMYWLNTFRDSTDKTTKIAAESQPHEPDAIKRSGDFKNRYLTRLEELEMSPGSYGRLSVRSLLNVREHLLNELYFPDPYINIKRRENEYFLQHLGIRFKTLDTILDRKVKWEKLITGVLVGNFVDWGAKEVTQLIEQHPDKILDFDLAAEKIQKRPWLIDDMDLVVDKIESYKCAAIFVDNSGADVVFGMIPFARELVRSGTKVILVVNSRPALNDATVFEMHVILQRLQSIDEEIGNFINDGKLSVMENGSGSPCINLTSVPRDLCSALTEGGCDLLVLEGMGRAIHTNFDAQFNIDCLKLAVLKNKWIASKLNGKLFDAVCKFG